MKADYMTYNKKIKRYSNNINQSHRIAFRHSKGIQSAVKLNSAKPFLKKTIFKKHYNSNLLTLKFSKKK